MVQKRNPDYSESAENLDNSPVLGNLLSKLRESQGALAALRVVAESHIPQDVKDGIAATVAGIGELDRAIRSVIETMGSYQDVEAGMYAVKQRKISLSYDPAAFKATYPLFASAVIVEVVNIKALEGLIKGNLLSPEDLKEKGVTQETVKHVYIVKA